MLQTCTKQSNNPYYIQAVDKNVYSLEEINYFIYNHINLVYEEFFCEKLFGYIADELGEKELAAKLEKLFDKGASVREYIMCILTNSGYYSSNDMAQIAELVTNINNMSKAQRMLLEAELMFKQKKYDSALHVYLEILNNRPKDENDQFYANIAFTIGIIYARLFMTKNAAAYFAIAYDIYPDSRYAKASVYISIINNNDEELLRTIIKYKVSDEDLARIRAAVESMRNKLTQADEYVQFENTLSNAENMEKQIAKWKNAYYNMLS